MPGGFSCFGYRVLWGVSGFWVSGRRGWRELEDGGREAEERAFIIGYLVIIGGRGREAF